MRTFITSGLGTLLLAAAVLAADEKGFTSIYQSPGDAARWIIAAGKPLPAANATAEGINPHRSGGYIVFYDTPVKDFVLDFDYKLSKGCNSGVFVRTGDIKDPVMTGIEVALDDTKGTGLHDPGAFIHLPEGEADLVLSGHTHGGQVGLVSLGLPYTMMRAFVKMPDHGLWARGTDRLYVHRGTGHYGFPLRLGVPAEESVLSVHSPAHHGAPLPS